MDDKKIVQLRHQLNYDDGSGPRVAVSYNSEFKFDRDTSGERYIKIEGIGGSVLIYATDLPFVIDALGSIREVL